MCRICKKVQISKNFSQIDFHDDIKVSFKSKTHKIEGFLQGVWWIPPPAHLPAVGRVVADMKNIVAQAVVVNLFFNKSFLLKINVTHHLLWRHYMDWPLSKLRLKENMWAINWTAWPKMKAQYSGVSSAVTFKPQTIELKSYFLDGNTNQPHFKHFKRPKIISSH